MKRYCLFLSLLFVISHTLYAEIKNGYEKHIVSDRMSLKGLKEILSTTAELSSYEKRALRKKMEALIEQISYYEVTERLLNEFRMIAPDLYNEIAEITDRKGRKVDVYIKFIPAQQGQVQAAGTTSIQQAASDPDAYASAYGENTVSVKIWIVSKSMWVLSHELGHVKYQVPNLASYLDFYQTNYQSRMSDPNHLGHNTNDPSGQYALSFEKRFRAIYMQSLKSGKEMKCPVLLLTEVKKEIEQDVLYGDSLAKFVIN